MKLKIILTMIFVFSSLHANSQCTPEQSIQLKKTWREFVVASKTEDPKIMASFFKFPLRLLGYYQEDKPLVISKQFFLKNYKLMFVDSQVPGNSDLYAEFELVKKLSDEKIFGVSQQRSCGGVNSAHPTISIGMFRLYWNVNTGWLIQDIYYSDHDKKILFYMIKNS